MVAAVLKTEPAPLARVATGPPAESRRIVQKRLERDREERYPTAAELSADLRRSQKRMDAGDIGALPQLKVIARSYGDESRVSIDPCVPYGRRFAGEEVFMPSVESVGLNCFAFVDEGQRPAVRCRAPAHHESVQHRAVGALVVLHQEGAGRGVGQRASSHLAAGAGAAWVTPLLLAAVLAAPEPRRGLRLEGFTDGLG